jgi:tetratricopeptide (TPR) repeat protein
MVVAPVKVSGRGTIVNSNLRRPSLAIILLAGFAVGGCGSIQPEIFESSFWYGSPMKENEEAELGLGELAKGNAVAAENHFDKALEANPQDLYALVGAGIMYQNTGQKTKAREMYEAVIALRPTESDRFVVWNTTDTRPISEIASVNLALMESGGVAAEVQQGAASAGGTSGSGNGGFPGGTMANGAARIGMVNAGVWTNGQLGSNGVSLLGLTDADANVVSRFETMRVLRDQGLVTPDEYAVRRQANIGALLPLSSPPPAAGLDRPVPGTQEIVGRLRAIGRALEMRALTVSEHAAERSMIVDALMPATPLMTAPPAPPPQGLMEAADTVRKLEQLRDAGYITADEYAKERAAVERALLPPPPVVPSVAAAAPSAIASPPARTAVGAPVALTAPPTGAVAGAARNEGGVSRPAVHLASYRSRKDAERGWTVVRRAYQQLLDGLTAEITEVDLGPDRGLYFRLNAGPMESEAAAVDLCRKLKRRHQYCKPTMVKAG